MLTGPRMVSGLLVPADRDRPVVLLDLEDSSRLFSDVLGGGLLDDSTTTCTRSGDLVAVYLTMGRLCLPGNPRAAVLAARLGLHERGFLAALRGDMLLTGLDAMGADIDVPLDVLHQATRSAIMPAAMAATVHG
jgi:hypothetical protein